MSMFYLQNAVLADVNKVNLSARYRISGSSNENEKERREECKVLETEFNSSMAGVHELVMHT